MTSDRTSPVLNGHICPFLFTVEVLDKGNKGTAVSEYHFICNKVQYHKLKCIGLVVRETSVKINKIEIYKKAIYKTIATIQLNLLQRCSPRLW